MHYRLRSLDLDSKMCHHLSFEIIEEVYPRQMICEQLSQHQAWEERERKLNMLAIIYVLLASALWSREAFPRVLERLARPLHLLGVPLKAMHVQGSAISARRQQLGSAPLRGLFAQACRPMCTSQTIGALRFGKRLMALDGTRQDVADTPANAAAFARPSNQYGPGPFPQIRLLLLSECGSHAVVDAVVDSCAVTERTQAEAIVASLEPDMFLLHDAQFTGRPFWQAVRDRGAHVMGPLPSHHLHRYLRQLSDGSYLAAYTPGRGQSKGEKPLLVRVIEYRITDERLGEPDQVYRLATTWLNPRTAPALELVECYHERWEVELVLDEIKTHQRLQQPVLRSRTPEGVRQEVYAILLAHYVVRFWMHQAACQAQVDPDRLSFTDAVFVLTEATRELALVEPAEREGLLQEMRERLTAQVLPLRCLRVNPRVLKKLYRKYKRKSCNEPPPPPFDPTDQFLDFVVLLI
ncbi:transposase [Dictyobacter vulcani]|uniref:Transposase n=1 Tax=Dictyobacter vulcani TaxID=2607529 RepID=A0A5J4KR28_9CHLR|nr:IS4 family transposase [Dictyobacter vulcani]GER88589.1 transposase [Dictyobacter vulcani]